MSENPIDNIFKEIQRQLDDPEVLYTLGSQQKNFEAMPFGIPNVDDALSGGIPTGRITEMFGAEASGKTTLMLHAVATAQKKGDLVYYVDAENSLDVSYAMRIGVDPKKLYISQPEYGEQALEVIRLICEQVAKYQEKSGLRQRALVVVDSVPALVPKTQFVSYQKSGVEGTSTMASRAQMLSDQIPKILQPLTHSKISLVFINQERDKIGVSWGSPTTQPGGRALKFLASLRIKVTRTGYVTQGGEKIGINTTIIPVKSKMYWPFNRKAEIVITGNGVDLYAGLIDSILEKKIVEKKGPWLNCGTRKWQGRAALDEELRRNYKLVEYFEAVLKKASENPVVVNAEQVEEVKQDEVTEKSDENN